MIITSLSQRHLYLDRGHGGRTADEQPVCTGASSHPAGRMIISGKSIGREVKRHMGSLPGRDRHASESPQRLQRPRRVSRIDKIYLYYLLAIHRACIAYRHRETEAIPCLHRCRRDRWSTILIRRITQSMAERIERFATEIPISAPFHVIVLKIRKLRIVPIKSNR